MMVVMFFLFKRRGCFKTSGVSVDGRVYSDHSVTCVDTRVICAVGVNIEMYDILKEISLSQISECVV